MAPARGPWQVGVPPRRSRAALLSAVVRDCLGAVARIAPAAARATGVAIGIAIAIGSALGAGLACVPQRADWLSEKTVDTLVSRAVRARGLSPAGPLRVRRLAPGEVRRHLADEFDRLVTPAELARDEALKHALGLLPPGADLREAILAFQTGTVVGFYAPLDRALHVVGDGARRAPLAPEAETVVVHEIVHALQDQHTGLLDVTLGLLDHDDLAFALGALLEGDATWAGFRDEATESGHPPPSAEAFRAEMAHFDAESRALRAPRLLRDLFLLQYPAGYALVEELVERGGVAALDDALFDPPLSSQEVLHPERYLEGRRLLAMPALDGGAFVPDAACEELTRNTFGELGLRVFAAEAGVGDAEAAAAAAGWRADRAVLLDCPGGRAFAWLVHFDDRVAALAFLVQVRARPWQGVTEGLRAAPRLDARGARLLFSAGLEEDGRRWLLESAELVGFRDLTAYLTARPAILERARRLRESAPPATSDAEP